MDRIWIGIDPETLHYRPEYDGGMMIEVLPLQALQLPEEALQDPPPEPRIPRRER